MITEDYCSYEVSKMLKEKGFDEPCLQMWECGPDKKYLFRLQSSYYQNITEKDSCLAPTHQMALKWLREVHKICIVVYPFTHRERGTYTSDICTVTMTMEEGHLRGVWNSYEEAVEAALKYVLEDLI